ncbi:MAG: hypothetical protein HXY22_10845 [Alphaproteobacteria bacterium]|nr:hypothetical protein [Alphaproteobacteria bacterium]
MFMPSKDGFASMLWAATLPFRFLGPALYKSLPYIGVGTACFIVPGFLETIPFFQSKDEDVRLIVNLIDLVCLTFVFTSFWAAFCATYLVAAQYQFGDNPKRLSISALRGKLLPKILGILVFLMQYSFLASMLYASDVRSQWEDLSTEAGIGLYILDLVIGYFAPFLNPITLVTGFISTIYCAFVARQGAATFEDALVILGERSEGRKEVLNEISAHKERYAGLIFIPHVGFGLLFIAYTASVPSFGIEDLLTGASSPTSSLFLAVGYSALFNGTLAVLAVLLAGYMAATWMLAYREGAERTPEAEPVSDTPADALRTITRAPASVAAAAPASSLTSWTPTPRGPARKAFGRRGRA